MSGQLPDRRRPSAGGRIFSRPLPILLLEAHSVPTPAKCRRRPAASTSDDGG
jgi:hypothetical protein